MSDEQISFSALVEQARREPPPPVDIVHRVSARIADGAPVAPPTDRILWGLAGVSVGAAAAVFLVCAGQGILPGDPLVDWLRWLMVVTI